MSENMKAALVPFLFEGEALVRVVTIEDVPWFVAADVCRALGIKNTAQAVECLDDDEKGLCSTYTPGGSQELLIISEGGLYTLVLRSRDATKSGTVPHRFRKWVTGEVLPAIRKTGRYDTRGTANAHQDAPPSLANTPYKNWTDEQIALFFRCLDSINRIGGRAASINWATDMGFPWPEPMPGFMRQMSLFDRAN